MNKILDALDALGLALADHGHKWTDHERRLYEDAVAIASSGGYTATDSLASKRCSSQMPCHKLLPSSARA
jgi:hypothetical protein